MEDAGSAPGRGALTKAVAIRALHGRRRLIRDSRLGAGSHLDRFMITEALGSVWKDVENTGPIRYRLTRAQWGRPPMLPFHPRLPSKLAPVTACQLDDTAAIYWLRLTISHLTLTFLSFH